MFLFLLTSLLACFTALVSSTALTYRVPANDQQCFFAQVDNKGSKVAFYFAVRVAINGITNKY